MLEIAQVSWTFIESCNQAVNIHAMLLARSKLVRVVILLLPWGFIMISLKWYVSHGKVNVQYVFYNNRPVGLLFFKGLF